MLKDCFEGFASAKNVICLDPGLEGTGFAYFHNLYGKATKTSLQKPRDSGVWRAGKYEWKTKAVLLWKQFNYYCSHHHVEKLVMEFPELWLVNSKSVASATTGDLFKLAYLIGGFANNFLDAKVFLLAPKEWKGQLPKQIIHNRLTDLGFPPLREHEADAVGIGIALQGGLFL
jgi:hypothetical protein